METTLIKYGVVGLVVIVLLAAVGAYSYTKGNAAGYQTAWDKQQKTIQAMTDAENAQRTAQNYAITQLEQQASSYAAQAMQNKFDALNAQSALAKAYKQKNPQVAASCGWSLPTVAVINSILAVGQPSAPSPASAPGVSK